MDGLSLRDPEGFCAVTSAKLSAGNLVKGQIKRHPQSDDDGRARFPNDDDDDDDDDDDNLWSVDIPEEAVRQSRNKNGSFTAVVRFKNMSSVRRLMVQSSDLYPLHNALHDSCVCAWLKGRVG